MNYKIIYYALHYLVLKYPTIPHYLLNNILDKFLSIIKKDKEIIIMPLEEDPEWLYVTYI